MKKLMPQRKQNILIMALGVAISATEAVQAQWLPTYPQQDWAPTPSLSTPTSYRDCCPTSPLAEIVKEKAAERAAQQAQVQQAIQQLAYGMAQCQARRQAEKQAEQR